LCVQYIYKFPEEGNLIHKKKLFKKQKNVT